MRPLLARSAWLAALWLPLAAYGQFELLVARGAILEPAPATIDVGAIAVEDAVDVSLRLRNVTAAPATLSTLRLTGAGFSLVNEPNLPLTLGPQLMVAFRVRFQPPAVGAYTATLRFNDATVTFRGATLPSLTVLLEEDGSFRPLRSADRVNFGALELDQRAERRFLLRNDTGTPLAAESVTLSGEPFAFTEPPGLPLAVAPGQAVALTVRFTARAGGLHTGTLTVDGRLFFLDAFVERPPPPQPSVTAEPAVLSSAETGRITVRFSGPARVAGTGTLTLAFTPVNSLARDDPAIQFATGGRSVSFSFDAGAGMARFGSSSEISFQTGTTAGLLVFQARVDSLAGRAEVRIEPAAVKIGSVAAQRTVGQIDVTFTGFDNSRTASQLRFRFFDSNGTLVPPGAIPVDVAAPFRDFFGQSPAGGAFQIQARFPVTGDANAVRSVEVEIENGVGRTVADRVGF